MHCEITAGQQYWWITGGATTPVAWYKGMLALYLFLSTEQYGEATVTTAATIC